MGLAKTRLDTATCSKISRGGGLDSVALHAHDGLDKKLRLRRPARILHGAIAGPKLAYVAASL